MVLNLENYRFRGATAEGKGRTILEAVNDLGEFWDSRPSLVVHNWGALELRINIEGTEAVFEVTDPDILDMLEVGDTGPLMIWMAQNMGVDPETAADLLDRSSDVVVVVDRIRPPGDQSWSPESGAAADDVLPEATLAWVGEVGRQVDVQTKRGKGRPRTGKARRMLDAVVQASTERGLSDREISKDTGIPKSTIRDTRMRLARKTSVRKEFQARTPGKRLTIEQKALVVDTLAANENNAAETARQLGLAARTVRGIRQRAERATPKVTTTAGRGRYTELEKASLIQKVNDGMTATEAGRALGVPGRTARGWVNKAKKDES